jgi:hypothetical protein
VEVPDKKIKIKVPYNLAVPLLDMYPKECNSACSRNTCTPMFTTALFTIAKLQNQTMCLSSNDWIKRM